MKANKILSGSEVAKAEALRYLDNAAAILKEKAGKIDERYSDKKYVRMAGNTIWNGVLEALDYKFPEIKTGKGRGSILKYKEAVSKTDKKILSYLVDCYDLAHLAMGYDGNLRYSLAKETFIVAERIVDWATKK